MAMSREELNRAFREVAAMEFTDVPLEDDISVSCATNGGTYRPQAGDIFFTGPSSDNATHTGIVVSINGTTITYVDGNGTGDVVKQRTMSWSNTSLLGFAHPAYASSTHSWVNQSGYYQCLICGQTASTIPIAPASLNYE